MDEGGALCALAVLVANPTTVMDRHRVAGLQPRGIRRNVVSVFDGSICSSVAVESASMPFIRPSSLSSNLARHYYADFFGPTELAGSIVQL